MPVQAQQVYNFNVPRGELAGVITRIAQTAGTPIAFPAGLGAGKVAGPIQGSNTVLGALQQALAGSGLQIAQVPGGGFVVRDPSAAGSPATLDGDVVAIDVIDVSGGGSYNDEGFKAGDAGQTVRIGDAPIKEIPIPVTAVTNDAIKSQQLTKTTDAVQNVAGVSLNSTADGAVNFTIRGFKGAGYTIDGQNAGLSALIPVDGVERVEVLKGPTSILTGVSNNGGIVNVALKKPTEDEIREITTRFGSDLYKTVAIDLGGAVEGTQGLSYRFVASGNHANENYGGYEDAHEVLLQPSVRWRGEDLTLEIGGQYIDLRSPQTPATFVGSRADGSLGVFDLPLGVPLVNKDAGMEQTRAMFYSDQSYRVRGIGAFDVTLNNHFQYTKLDHSARTISLYEPFPAGIETTVVDYVAELNDYTNNNLTNRFDVTVKRDFDLASQFLKFGYDYISHKQEPRYGSGSFSSVDVTTGLPHSEWGDIPYMVISENGQVINGIYVVSKTDLFDDRLHVLGSLRYDWVDQSTYRTGVGSPISREEEFSGRSWVLGAAYDLTSWLTVYGNRSEGFVPGGVSTLGEIFPPEGRDLKEAGVRLSLLDDRLSLTASLFELKRTNVSVPVPNVPGSHILVGGQESKGVEFEVQGEVLPGLSVIGSFTDLTVTSSDQVALNISGIPETTASLWFRYAFQNEELRGFSFGGGARYTSESAVPYGNRDFKLPSFTVVDAAVGYETDNFSIDLSVKNVFDERYFEPSYFFFHVPIGRSREFLLTSSYKF